MLGFKGNYFKTGLIHFMAYPDVQESERNVVETIKRIASDAYFDTIEITAIKSQKKRNQVKKILDASGMKTAFCGQLVQLQSGTNINDVNEDKRKEAVKLLKKVIDQAYELEADSFSFMSGQYDENQKESAYQALVKSSQELCEYAKQKGEIKVAFEVFDFDIDKKCLVGPAALAKRYAQEIRETYPKFGLIVDLSHLPLLRETNEYCIGMLKEYITHIHIGNCVIKDSNLPGYGDKHPRFGFPRGENDVYELTWFLKELLKQDLLDGSIIVSFEVKPFGDEDTEVVIANSKRKLNKAWDNLRNEI